MFFPIKKSLVNWVDGMKISRVHLQQTENYFIDIHRDLINIGLTDNNFGLLPPYSGRSRSCEIDLVERVTNRVEIRLKQCNAITAGGCRVNINPTDHNDHLVLDYSFAPDIEQGEKNKNEEPTFWNVILIIKPFDRIATGYPDPEETPPRHPDAKMAYELAVKPTGEINSGDLGIHHLVIGRIILENDHYVVDNTYIPPSTSMSSHPYLKHYHEVFGKYINDIETASHKIIQKNHERESTSDIAKNVHSICEDLLKYIATVYYDFRNNGRFYTPANMINIFSSLAHIGYVSIHLLPKKKREEMLQYFYEWKDITPGVFVDTLSEILEITYNHYDIRTIMEKTEYFLQNFATLWVRLSTLEYIGQHRENIVVAEKKQKEEKAPAKPGWTIID